MGMWRICPKKKVPVQFRGLKGHEYKLFVEAGDVHTETIHCCRTLAAKPPGEESLKKIETNKN
jgi:hypothetical protein